MLLYIYIHIIYEWKTGRECSHNNIWMSLMSTNSIKFFFSITFHHLVMVVMVVMVMHTMIVPVLFCVLHDSLLSLPEWMYECMFEWSSEGSTVSVLFGLKTTCLLTNCPNYPYYTFYLSSCKSFICYSLCVCVCMYVCALSSYLHTGNPMIVH